MLLFFITCAVVDGLRADALGADLTKETAALVNGATDMQKEEARLVEKEKEESREVARVEKEVVKEANKISILLEHTKNKLDKCASTFSKLIERDIQVKHDTNYKTDTADTVVVDFLNELKRLSDEMGSTVSTVKSALDGLRDLTVPNFKMLSRPKILTTAELKAMLSVKFQK